MIVIQNPRARKALRILVPAAGLPIVLILSLLAGEKRYLPLSLAVAMLALLLFFASFEHKKIGSRRMVLVSVITALSVAGRFIPFFKPVTAFAILTGITLGGESAFLVGALSALLSNFSFGQGPWTPFQMIAWGGIGLLSAPLSSLLRKSRPMLLVYGLCSGILYSLLMDVWSVAWYSGEVSLPLLASAALTALPHTALYCASNLLFLWLFAKPFCEKLDRIQTKYGI